jgi:ACS family hexuronate transporter-like MFS transporter
MPVLTPDVRLPARSHNWRWWVCCLLLLATMINYMDRLTLNQLAPDIQADLGFDDRGYGRIEAGFALAFALGAIGFGFIVDRWNVFWVYPVAVLAWSAAGFCSGFADGFATLLLCRFLLGLAESANWPCALRTTQRILQPGERSMGNSILQSGAALGAVLIPLIMLVLFDPDRPSTWRAPFLAVGACGALWVVLWWLSVRRADLALNLAPPAAGANGKAGLPAAGLPRGLFARRFAALVVLVVTINMTWHFLRAWLPKYLRTPELGYSPQMTNWFSSGYYVFADVGALSAGFLTLTLARRGVAVHTSRRLVFLGYALLAALCLAAPFLSAGPLLLALLLVIGFGSLGVFPNYYSFSQDLTVRHQGKVTGVLGCCCWVAMAGWQELIGQLVYHTRSYTLCFVIAGLAPLVGFLALVVLWGPTAPVPAAAPPPEPAAPAEAGPAEERVFAPSGVRDGPDCVARRPRVS